MKIYWSIAFLVVLSCADQQTPIETPLSHQAQDDVAVLLKHARLKKDALTQNQKQRLFAIANETRCPCSTLKTSLRECADPKQCVRAPFALRAIAQYLVKEKTNVEISSALVERFTLRTPETIDLSQAPCKGKKDAPVTMVIFSDFQCPFCSRARGLIEYLMEKRADTLRVCFMNFVIHDSSRLAAKAALAADRQGKFWPYHDRLFENMRSLERDDLLSYAKALALDMTQFKTDLDGSELDEVLKAHDKQAKVLRLRGTPSFFINGRPMNDLKNPPFFLDWIDEELALKAETSAH